MIAVFVGSLWFAEWWQ